MTVSISVHKLSLKDSISFNMQVLVTVIVNNVITIKCTTRKIIQTILNLSNRG